MKNGVILYQSKYGATKQYAKWLADQTGFSMVETKKADIEQIKVFDTVILGGGIYASGIARLSFCASIWTFCKTRNWWFFVSVLRLLRKRHFKKLLNTI